MPPPPDAIDQIAREIESYLVCHPEASDTLHGVQAWWLSGEQTGRTEEAVQRALDRLVAEGTLAKKDLPDGRAVYAASHDRDWRRTRD